MEQTKCWEKRVEGNVGMMVKGPGQWGGCASTTTGQGWGLRELAMCQCTQKRRCLIRPRSHLSHTHTPPGQYNGLTSHILLLPLPSIPLLLVGQYMLYPTAQIVSRADKILLQPWYYDTPSPQKSNCFYIFIIMWGKKHACNCSSHTRKFKLCIMTALVFQTTNISTLFTFLLHCGAFVCCLPTGVQQFKL